MEFRLTYEGPLYGSGNSARRITHKHEIRRALHLQLSMYWEQTIALSKRTEASVPWKDYLSSKHQVGAYRFVPLVVEELSLHCSVSILFLRPDPPGKVLSSGDLDNRLKTLFEALRAPKTVSEIRDFETPGEGENPFFVLVSDDSLISQVSVETDLLLQPTGKCPGYNDARLIIAVKIRPYTVTIDNLDFV